MTEEILHELEAAAADAIAAHPDLLAGWTFDVRVEPGMFLILALWLGSVSANTNTELVASDDTKSGAPALLLMPPLFHRR